MIEHLEKWMYVNDIKNEKLLLVAKIIEQTKQEPIIFTSKWEILYYFWLLVKWKMKVEDFYMFKDTFFNKKPYKYKIYNWFDALDYIKFNYKKNKIYILDNLFETNLRKENVYFI
jgi:hypothetical protein